MSQRLYLYRIIGAGNDERLGRWFDKEEAPPPIVHADGLAWELIPDKPRDTTVVYKRTIDPFVSIQLPRWWPFAADHDEEGRCRFKNRTEAEESCRVARAAGEHVVFDY